jgi:hypothetical protein
MIEHKPEERLFKIAHTRPEETFQRNDCGENSAA